MIKVLALVVDEHKIIKPLERLDFLGIEYLVVNSNTTLSEPFPDLIVTVSDWRHDIARLLYDAKKRNIPTLLLQDGTLDWILQFEGDKYGGKGGPTHYHPILTDKIACIGAASARVISSFSGVESVEVTGFPKMYDEILDAGKYNSLKRQSENESKKRTILITSPRQGWFSDTQKSALIQALIDLKVFTDNRKDIKCIWRLSRNLASLIGVENSMKEKESFELVELIKESDIVISAQSTVVLEAMLYNKPVAIIDYLNSPQFYNTAWFINHRDQISKCINDMLKVPPQKMLFQEFQLRDNLSLDSDPIEQCGQLIDSMVRYKKSTNSTIFPTNMLRFNSPFPKIKTGNNLPLFYPNVLAFKYNDVSRLQFLYNRLLHERKSGKSIVAQIKRVFSKLSNSLFGNKNINLY